jgi:hypothetical protein
MNFGRLKFCHQQFLLDIKSIYTKETPRRRITREEVFMEGPIEPNMRPSLADVLLCTFESTNAGFSSFPVRKLLD